MRKLIWKLKRLFERKYVSVTIWRCEPDCDPWTAVFADRSKAEMFAEKAWEIIDRHDLDMIVTIDSGFVNDESYMDVLEATCYDEDEEE